MPFLLEKIKIKYEILFDSIFKYEILINLIFNNGLGPLALVKRELNLRFQVGLLFRIKIRTINISGQKINGQDYIYHNHPFAI
jgi:hypothetical protein